MSRITSHRPPGPWEWIMLHLWPLYMHMHRKYSICTALRSTQQRPAIVLPTEGAPMRQGHLCYHVETDGYVDECAWRLHRWAEDEWAAGRLDTTALLAHMAAARETAEAERARPTPSTCVSGSRPRPWAWRTFIALSCTMTDANAARKRSSLGLHKGGHSALVHVFTRPGGVSEDVSSSGVPWGFPTVSGSKCHVRIVAARRLASERCSLSAFLPAPDRGLPFGTSLS